MKITKGTIIRTVVLIASLGNTLLTAWGKNPFPWSEDEMYTGVSTMVTVAAALAAWWKNNSFTQSAIKADEYMHELKGE